MGADRVGRCLRGLAFVIPGLDALRASTLISKEMAGHKKSVDDGATAGYTHLGLDALKDLFKQTLYRKEQLEVKARTNIGVVAIAFSLLSPTVTILSQDPKNGWSPIAETIFRVIITAGFLQLFLAGFWAYWSIRVREWHMPTIRSKDESEGSGSASDKEKDDIGWCVKLDEMILVDVTNYMIASFRALFTGLGLFAVAIFMVLWGR